MNEEEVNPNQSEEASTPSGDELQDVPVSSATDAVGAPSGSVTDPVPPSQPPAYLPPQWGGSVPPPNPGAIPAGAPYAPAVTNQLPQAPSVPPPPMPPVWPVQAPAGGAPVPPVKESAGNGAGWKVAVVSLAAALIGALVGGGIVAASNSSSGSAATIRQISAGPALLNGVTNVESVIDRVLPSVVSITATSPVPVTQGFFGNSGGGTQTDEGTGVIVTSKGEVVTNNHVISGATKITVTLYGSLKALPAHLIDTDPIDDVALLQIDNASNLPTVTYGNSDNVQVGDAVVAIGNALGLSAGTPTVTSGIISAKGRTVQATDSSGNVTETLTNMFQTDAAINPGNSGGPLVDSSGRVIGMNTAVASNDSGTGQAQNIGFAIPANKVVSLLPALRSGNAPNPALHGPGFLGIQLETLTPQLQQEYNFVPSQGAVVLQVVPGTPASTAGLEEGDVITAFNGTAVKSADALATAIQRLKPGTQVKIDFYRGQAQSSVTATLGSASQYQGARAG